MTRQRTVVAIGLLIAIPILVPILGSAGCTTDQRVGAFIDLTPAPDAGGLADAATVDTEPPPDSGGAPIDVADDVLDAAPDGTVGTPYFAVVPAGRTLPTEATCAAMVRRGTPETRPDNTTFNNTIPPADQVAGLSQFGGGRGFDSAAIPLGKRISGNFTGSTDEILQWAACKWGFDEDLVRAQSYQVNGWHQAALSGWTGNASNCPTGGPTRMAQGETQCAQVFGVFGVTWQYHKSSWPMVRDSTAFNFDYSLGLQRVCFEGLVAYMRNWGPPGKVYGPNDAIGCAASFFTGGWYDDTTQQTVNRIRDTLANKPWKTGM